MPIPSRSQKEKLTLVLETYRITRNGVATSEALRQNVSSIREAFDCWADLGGEYHGMIFDSSGKLLFEATADCVHGDEEAQ